MRMVLHHNSYVLRMARIIVPVTESAAATTGRTDTALQASAIIDDQLGAEAGEDSQDLATHQGKSFK
jgi:hypothetical protein